MHSIHIFENHSPTLQDLLLLGQKQATLVGGFWSSIEVQSHKNATWAVTFPPSFLNISPPLRCSKHTLSLLLHACIQRHVSIFISYIRGTYRYIAWQATSMEGIGVTLCVSTCLIYVTCIISLNVNHQFHSTCKLLRKRNKTLLCMHNTYSCNETRHLHGRHRSLVIRRLRPYFTLHASYDSPLIVTLLIHTTRFKKKNIELCYFMWTSRLR